PAPKGAQQGAPQTGAGGAQQAQPGGGGPAGAAGAAAARKPDEKGPFAPWDTVLKDTRPVEGYFKTYLKRDNTLLLELRPEQLGKQFGLIMHQSRGVGDFNLIRGLPLSDTQLLEFRRVGDKIMLVRLNPRYTAPQGSPMEEASALNVGNSIVGAFKIESENATTKSLLVNLTPFLVSDYADLGSWFRVVFERKPVSLDQNRSYVGKVMGFPKNVEIDAELTFAMSEFPTNSSGSTLSDYRSMPLGVRYSFFALPEKPLTARLADDRVGHFTDVVRDFSRDRKESEYLRYVNRWRLEKKNNNVAVSEPVQPIVYYIDRSVPMEYRQYVKEGIEAWQKAFEAAGFKNAIIAKDAPADSTWSAEDARYSTVRWTAAERMGYAIGPSQSDPRTGEILNADVLISSEFVHGWIRNYQRYTGPSAKALAESMPGGAEAAAAFLQVMDEEQRLRVQLPSYLSQRLCSAEMGRAYQMDAQFAMLAGLGVLDPGKPVPESYIGDALRDLIMHEVGHTLGLQHNFKASSAIPYDKLNDTSFTRKHGLTLSVMEYGAVNVAADPSKQGDYWNETVGDYDVWAIKYAYAPVYEESGNGGEPRYAAFGTPVTTTAAEEKALKLVAGEGADPMHAFGNDLDASFGGFAVDPLANVWELSADPIRFADDRTAIVKRVLPKLEDRLLLPGDGYQTLRAAVGSLLGVRLTSLLPVTKTVGGMYVNRDHKGDPNGRAPFVPVPAERQRAAVKLIVDNAFAEDAIKLDPQMLNKLAPTKFADFGSNFSFQADYPVHDVIASQQTVLLNALLEPTRLRRMVDNGVRMPNGAEAYTAGELYQTLSKAIWSELGDGSRPREVSSVRRNLQRAHVERLTDLLVGARLQPPEDARSLSRLELTDLSAALGRAATSGGRSLDRETRAHFAESKARIDRALAASLSVPNRP
ncbi:MAG TPA: zinc-dependent metalloprotease, partial [Gemmatimonadaceae bacterium]|nr:zinc-dependent metalloprotease [Gemmatimonadaceae bacterium]